MAIYIKKIKNGQHGFFLIEVLITTVVVAIGLLSLASLQGGFMSSSGESKARTEAVMLAEAKQEQFRNNIIKGNYEAVASGSENGPITGTNATFSRSWVVSTTTAPGRKKISVTVTWYHDEASDAEKVDKTVNLFSELVWFDTNTATDYATNGNGLTGKIQSPNNNSSAVGETAFDRSEITGEVALNDGSNLIKYDDNEGHVYLLDAAGNALIKFNGGVIHAIKGKVYSGTVSGGTPSLSPLTAYPVTFSDLAYCVFPVTTGQSDYICYFGGDCSNTGSGCPNETETDDYSVVFGGWYGKVGLLETSSTDFHNKKVCFAEDIASDVSLTATTTARLYATQRLNADNVVTRLEGINQSFACQDFLVVSATGNSNDCHYFKNYPGVSVPSSSVQRPLGVDDEGDPIPNESLPVDSSSCGTTVTYTINGGIVGNQSNLVSVFVDGNSCAITAENNVYGYSCTIKTVNTKTSLTITANGGNVTPATTELENLQSSMTGPTLIADSADPVITTYSITGVISGDLASQGIPALSGGTCTKAVNVDGVTYTYTCTITTTPTTVTITASGGNVTLAAGSVAQVTLAGVANLSGPNFVVTAPNADSCMVTVTGNIHEGISAKDPGNGAVKVSYSKSSPSGTGSCTKTNANDIYTYICAVGSVNNSGSVTISGNNVTVGTPNTVTVSCTTTTLILTGPNLTTTN